MDNLPSEDSRGTEGHTSGVVNPSDIQYEDGISTIRVTMSSRKAIFEPVAVKTDIPDSLSKGRTRHMNKTATSSSVSVKTESIAEESRKMNGDDSDNEVVSTLSDSQLPGNKEVESPRDGSIIQDNQSKKRSNPIKVNASNLSEITTKKNPKDSGVEVIGPNLINDKESFISAVSPVPIGPAVIKDRRNELQVKDPIVSSITTIDNRTVSVLSENGYINDKHPVVIKGNLKPGNAADPCVFTPIQNNDDMNNNDLHKRNKSVSWNETVTITDGVTSDVLLGSLQKEDHQYNPQSHDDLTPTDDFYELRYRVLLEDSFHMHKSLTSQRRCVRILAVLAILLVIVVVALAVAASWEFIKKSDDSTKIRDALKMSESVANTPFNSVVWHTTLDNNATTVFFLMDLGQEIISQRPSEEAYLYWHRGKDVKVTVSYSSGSTQSVILGDPLKRDGALFYTLLERKNVYSAAVDSGDDELALISIASKSDSSITWTKN